MAESIVGKSNRSQLVRGDDRPCPSETESGASHGRTAADRTIPGDDLLSAEEDLLRELMVALRGIRYGSVLLAVHDGRVVEINKTTRIRRTNGSL
jgi:hypothetical protein